MRKLVGAMVLFLSLFFFTHQAEASENSQLIIINKQTNTLAFYNSGVLVKTFKVATGRQRDLTPEGTFKIVNKIKNRPYYTGHIAGGDPRNPLGDRWMGLEARGTYGTTYGIHGNNNESSIGKYASSGCVRMHNAEVRWLFDQVRVSATVIITRSGASFDAIAKANGYGVSASTNVSAPIDSSIGPDGWVQTGNQKHYYVKGTLKTGWQTIAGKRYFFDGAGDMQTGWLTSGGKKYFLDANGVMKTGWITDNGKKFYLDGNGVMKTGWLQDEGKKYFLDPGGVMKTGWIEDAGKKYLLDATGAAQIGWRVDGEKKYFFDTTGVMQMGWVEDGGKKYWLDQTGAMKTGWLDDGGHRYYLDETGAMQTGWFDEAGKRHYFDAAGVMQTDWVKADGKWFYLDRAGVMQTGWINDKGMWFYLFANGATNSAYSPVNGSQQESGTDPAVWNRYLQSSAEDLTVSWLKYQDKWYYLYVNKGMAMTSKLDEAAQGKFSAVQ